MTKYDKRNSSTKRRERQAKQAPVRTDHRARLNSYFCSALQRTEQHDSVRFQARSREYERRTLDEVQVYRDVGAVEDRRRVEGKLPKVRFFTQEEQREWERQYLTPPGDVESEPRRSEAGRP